MCTRMYITTYVHVFTYTYTCMYFLPLVRMQTLNVCACVHAHTRVAHIQHSRSHALTLSHELVHFHDTVGSAWHGAAHELRGKDFQFLAVEFDLAPIKAKEFAWLGVVLVVHEVKLRMARGRSGAIGGHEQHKR
jgi:hypothetical protein